MSGRGRLFVAVIPPPRVLDLLETIPREPQPDVRYTTRDQWHVTLRFLGDADIGEASAEVHRVDAQSVDVSLGPRVERLGRTVAMVPCAGLDMVAAAVRRATADTEHPVSGFELAATFTATEIHLVRSHLAREGARYEVVATRSLRPV
ncbi:MAG: hypothetical protein E6G39_05315 [Actinobacteria bacterium]|nr:MAG: hypothetical protein E6G39_05315 [Actinomycetota bacterium]